MRRSTGIIPNEIKFTTLRDLPLRFQARLTRQIAAALADTGGFVSGFFTPTEGFVTELVRERLVGEADRVPDPHRHLYETARLDLLAQMGGPGQADLIQRLVLLPVAAIQCLLASFGSPFEVQYDPRQHEEDEAVRTRIGQDMNMMLTAPHPFRQDNYLGMDVNRRSEDELGLQIADVVAGQVRDFFRNNPTALEVGTTPVLITGESDEPLQRFEEIEGHLFKNASVHPMPTALRRIITRRNMANLISYYYPVLASGILTCITSNGQERDLEFSTGLITDLAD